MPIDFSLAARLAESPAIAWIAGLFVVSGIAALVLARRRRARVRAEAGARAIAAARESAHELAGWGVVVVDGSGRVLEANAVGRRLLWSAGDEAPDALPAPIRMLLADASPQQHTLRVGGSRLVDFAISAAQGSGQHRGIVARDVTEDHRGRDHLLQLAHFDSLTGLGNRRLFIDRLKLAIANARGDGSSIALLYVDIDRFKEVNDSLGHAAGDELLKAVSLRFRERMRAWQQRLPRGDSFVARLSGDEFAIFATGFPGIAEVEGLAGQILEAIGQPVDFEGRTIPSSASMGVAVLPDHGRDVEDLVKAADAALYVAKERGRGRFVVYEHAFTAQAEYDRKIENGLREAIRKGELRLHYQPKIEVADGTVSGFEALLRWYNPELGFVSPKDFIPIAEERGLICEIGAWCVDEACRQMRGWREAGFETVPVSVNVSSAQFSESDLQQVITNALVLHDIEPASFEIELTESLILDDNETTALALRDLRAIGVKVALDDFGTGYSALTYLNRFPLDTVKMDRGFLRGIEDDEAASGIAKAVVEMSHSLGFKVVAEGVDCERQALLLRRMGCDQIQGFLYSPGLPALEATRFLAPRGGSRPVVEPAAEGARVDRLIDSADAPSAQESSDRVADVATGAVAGEEGTPSDAPDPEASSRPARGSAETRSLVVDDGVGSVASLAVRMMRLGADVHLVQDVDEAAIFVDQDEPIVDLLVVPLAVDLRRVASLRERLEKATPGASIRILVVGDEVDDERRAELRKARVDWLVTGSIADVDLRFFVGAARHDGSQSHRKRAIRIPLETTAWIRAGGERRVATLTSLSRRGAFVETTDGYQIGQTIRIEFKACGTHVRVFGTVTYQHQAGHPSAPYRAAGFGIVFYEPDDDTTDQLDTIIEQTWTRYLP